VLAAALFAGPVSAQVLFREGFGTQADGSCVAPAGGPGTYPFPAGWLLRNVDARVPNGLVPYVNDAWAVRDEFPNVPTNCVAFSTSWYEPEGTADDWMWTPRINLRPGSVLSWRARSYDANFPDGYEVRVMTAAAGPPTGGTGLLGNQVSASTLVFSVAAEAIGWTTHSVQLDAFGSQGVYIGFRNNTNNRFLLVVDDVEVRVVAPDLRVVSPVRPGPWTRVPRGLSVPYALGVEVGNVGVLGVAAGTVPVATILSNGSPVGAPFDAAPLGIVAPLGFFNVVWNVTPPPTLPDGVVTTRYTVALPPNDTNPTNNIVETTPIVVGGGELARYLGAPSSLIGIGSGFEGEVGTTLNVPATLTAVGVRLRMLPKGPPATGASDQWTGQPVAARLRATDPSGRPLGAPLRTTLAGVGTRDGATYDLAFAAPITLAPGLYFVSAIEPAGAEPMPLALHEELFVEATNFVDWPTSPYGPWAPIEQFGPAFRRTPQIGLLTDLTLFGDGFD
jgi:hypothetical protein